MKPKSKDYYLCIFYSISVGIFNYLLLFNIIDAFLVFVLSLLVGIIFSYCYIRIKNHQKAEINANEFVIKMLSDFDTYHNLQLCYKENSYMLEDIGFNYSYEDIVANVDLFDRLSLGILTESLKAFFIYPTRKVYKTTILMIAQKNVDHFSEDKYFKDVRNTLYISLSLLAVFSIIRIVFGADLIDYTSVVFRIVSDSIYVMPIIVCSICTLVKEKQNERNIY